MRLFSPTRALIFNAATFDKQVADVGKKGWTDLSAMFNQKAGLYHDPNEATHSTSGYSSSGYNSSDTYNGGYQAEEHAASYNGTSSFDDGTSKKAESSTESYSLFASAGGAGSNSSS